MRHGRSPVTNSGSSGFLVCSEVRSDAVAISLMMARALRAAGNGIGIPARAIVDDYVGFYSDYLPAGISVDMSACNVTENELTGHGEEPSGPAAPGLEESIQRLSKALLRGLESEAVRNLVILAHWRSQSFKFDQYVDLWDFCAQLKQETTRRETEALKLAIPDEAAMCGEMASACGAVQYAIEDRRNNRRFVVKSQNAGVESQHAHGLSIYFPWNRTGADR